MRKLKDWDFFSSLPQLKIDQLEKRTFTRTYHQDEMIIDYEDESTDILFILQGKVRILYRAFTGRESILADLVAGDFFGELSAIDGAPRSANVTALERTVICSMPSKHFMELLSSEPEIGLHIIRTLVSRIRALDERFAEHSILPAKERIYSELLRLSKPRLGKKGQKIISPPPYHQMLANRVGCRREVVSRELSSLAKQDIVEKSRGGLVLLDPDELSRRLKAALNG